MTKEPVDTHLKDEGAPELTIIKPIPGWSLADLAALRSSILTGPEVPEPDRKLTIDEARAAGFSETELRLGLLKGWVFTAEGSQPVINWDPNAPIEGINGETVGGLEARARVMIGSILRTKGPLPLHFRRGRAQRTD